MVEKKYFSTINSTLFLGQWSHSLVVRSRIFLAGGSWGAGSNPGVATSSFFFSLSSYFYPSAFYSLFSLLTLLASRDFCENVFLVMLKRNSINLHCKFGARQKWESAGRICDFEFFWTVSLKGHDWLSWTLNECNLSWKIVKFCPRSVWYIVLFHLRCDV